MVGDLPLKFPRKSNSVATPLCETLGSMGSAVDLPQMCVEVTPRMLFLGTDFQSLQTYHRHE